MSSVLKVYDDNTSSWIDIPAIQGDTGTAAGFGTPTATVGTNTGTPSVSVTASGPDTAKVFSFAFDGLKGASGANGVGVPSGGTQGQVLTKSSATDYATEWANASGGDKVMYFSVRYVSGTYVSDTSIEDIVTAVGNGYDVLLKVDSTIYQLKSCSISDKSARFYYVNVNTSYVTEYYYFLSYNTSYTNNTRVQYSSNSMYKPSVMAQYYFKVRKTGENSYELYSSNASISNLDNLNAVEFGSAYLFIGEEGSDLPHTGYTQNFADFYSLTNYWNTEEYVEAYDEYEPFGNAVFSKIEIDNGAVKLKSFTIKQNMWDSDYSTVTYSEVSLGQAPSAQGVSF